MKSDAVLNIRIPAKVKEALARASESNMRTMSSMATWALAEWLAREGFLDRKELAARAPSTLKRGRS